MDVVVAWVLPSCSVWLPGYCFAVAKEFCVCLLAHCLHVLLACSERFLICCYVVAIVLLYAFRVFRVVACSW